MKENKLAFITGTIDKQIIKEIERLLEYLDYTSIPDISAYENNTEFDEEIKKERVNLILNSDVIVVYMQPWGKYNDIFKKEIMVAEYLGIPVIEYATSYNSNNDQMEILVIHKLLNQLLLKNLEDEKGSENDLLNDNENQEETENE